MKRIIIFALLVLFVFTFCSKENKSVHKPQEGRNIFGVWLGWENALSQSETRAIVKDLLKHHITDVFLLVKGIAGTKISANTLQDFIKISHDNNLKVHLWYAVNKDEAFLSKHPEAHNYHCPDPSKGHSQRYAMTNAGVNLLYPGYKEYVLNNIRYFLSHFDCDGIHLDYIRYSHFVYSWDDYHLKKADSLGCNTHRLLNLFVNDPRYYIHSEGFIELYRQGDKDVVTWVNMRKHVIYDYIKSIRELINDVKPEVMLTAAFMPEGATQPAWADVQYSQNYTLLSPLLDMISPMAYFKDYRQNTEWVKTVTQKALATVDRSCKISTGVQAFGGVSKNELKAEIELAKEAGSKGAIIYSYETVPSENWPVVDSLFARW
ncbi:family 10 glycosylhydrolase [Calditrichota bacterium GD2]